MAKKQNHQNEQQHDQQQNRQQTEQSFDQAGEQRQAGERTEQQGAQQQQPAQQQTRTLAGFDKDFLINEALKFVREQPVYAAVLGITLGVGIFKFARTEDGKRILNQAGAVLMPVVSRVFSDAIRHGVDTAQQRLTSTVTAQTTH